MLPEYRILGGLILLAVVGGAWLAIELLFGRDAVQSVAGVLGVLLAVVIVGGMFYGFVSGIVAWVRERLSWLGPDSAVRALHRWHRDGAQDPAALLKKLRSLPDLRLLERRQGETALHAAVRLHSFLGAELDPVLDLLLAAGADPQARCETDDGTPLDYVNHYSAPPQVAARLIAAGAIALTAKPTSSSPSALSGS